MSGPESSCITLEPTSGLTLRPELVIFPPSTDGKKIHYTIYDPNNDMSYNIGANELMVARLFDGKRKLIDISAYLKHNHQRHVSIEKLESFERRLLQHGLLCEPGSISKVRLQDPAAGITYGPLKSLLIIPLLRFQPSAMLDYAFEKVGWLCSPLFFKAGLIAIISAILMVVTHFDEFLSDVLAVYGVGLGWLLWHYPVVVASIAVHEFGHALACRLYKVRVTDFGVAIYLLMATGWARPLQGDWIGLSRRQRMITIAMGPFASLLFSTVGVLLWLMATKDSYLHTFGVVMTISASISLIPTLLPIFNGDAYLAMTEYFGVPRLRQRSFHYVKAILRSREYDEDVTEGQRILYLSTVVATTFGWALVWILVFKLLSSIFQS